MSAVLIADRSRQQTSLPIRQVRKRDCSFAVTLSLAILLTTAAVTLWLYGFVFVVGSIEEVFIRPNREYGGINQQLVFRDDGLPVWQKTDSRNVPATVEYSDLGGEPVEMKDNQLHCQMATMIDSRIWRQHKRNDWPWRVQFVTASEFDQRAPQGNWYFCDDGERGFFELVNLATRLPSAYVSRTGFSREKPKREEWFPTRSGDQRYDLLTARMRYVREPWSVGLLRFDEGSNQHSASGVYGQLLTEADGRRVYWIDWQTRRLSVVHEGEPVLATQFVQPSRLSESAKPLPKLAVLRLRDELRIVELTDHGPGNVQVVPIPEVLQRFAALQWVKTADGHTFVSTRDGGGWRLTMVDAEGREAGTRDVDERDRAIERPHPLLVTAAFVGVQSPALCDFWSWVVAHASYFHQNVDGSRVQQLGLLYPRRKVEEFGYSELIVPLSVLHLVAMVWPVLAVRRLRRFGGLGRDQCFWGAWTFAFGAPGYLAFRVHREWVRVAADVARTPASGRERSADEVDSCSATQVRDGIPKSVTAAVKLYERWLDRVESLGSRVAAGIGLTASQATLVAKELRLVAGFAVLASLAYLVMLGRMMGLRGLGTFDMFSVTTTIPFVSDRFTEPFLVIGVILAVAMAAWQTFAEARGESWLFLLHRPVSRHAIVLCKLGTGLIVLAIGTAWPILLYAAWAARPGSVAAPFEWSMTEIAWREWTVLGVIYLGVLMTLLRPARWIGTRLFPAIAAFGWLFVREPLEITWWPVWQELAVTVLIAAALISTTLLVAEEREYP